MTAALAPAAAPPQPAYPQPITLPPAPGGDPDAARRLAQSLRALADAVDDSARRACAVLDGLGATWHGVGSTARSTAYDAISADAVAIGRALRGVADHLDAYAHAIEHARHHHGFSLGRMLALGAAVAVGAAAIVVTVGAAAPVGSVAAAEIGEAVAGAEAATAAAGAAEASTAAALDDCASLLGRLRVLRLVAAGHLAQGAYGAGFDLAGQLLHSGRFSYGEIGEAFVVGAALSTGTGGALAAVRRAERYAALSGGARLAVDAAVTGGAQAATDAARQYVETGDLDPRRVLVAGVSGGGLYATGGLRGGLYLPAAAGKQRAGQTVDELISGRVDLTMHERGPHGGHTLRRHIGRPPQWLRRRIELEGHLAVSSFFDVATAQQAIAELLAAREPALRGLVAGTTTRDSVLLRGAVSRQAGYLLHADGRIEPTNFVCVRVARSASRVVILTAYLDTMANRCRQRVGP